MRDCIVSCAVALVILPFFLAGIGLIDAQVRQSSSYQIQSDSINIGGGLSSSTNYVSESTVGEIATGESSSASYDLKAGYQQMQEVYLALTGANAVTMDPAIPGVSGGESNGSTTITVITDGSAGYELTIAAENNPAMQFGANTIADYSPGGDPSFGFTTNATDSHFGYSPEGVDIVDRFRDSGGVCNQALGDDTLLACWDGLSTTAETILSRSGANHPDGSTTTIRFRVGIGGSVAQPPGIYVATTTITALPL